MTPEDRLLLVRRRMRQARDTLIQAEALAGISQWPGVVNRAYYAMFYAALALLLARGLRTRKHSGALALIDREFVRPGCCHASRPTHLRKAFSLRQDSDYDEASDITRDQAQTLLADSSTFVATVVETLQRLQTPPE